MRKDVAATAACIALFAMGFAMVPAVGLAADDRQGVDDALSDFLKRTGAPGVSVYVTVDGEVLWDRSSGFADLEQNVPISKDTVVRIGSIAKTMTAVAAVRLARLEKFDLDLPVGEYIRDYVGPAREVTVRQLGSHVGGVRKYRDDEYPSYVHYQSARSAMELVQDSPLETAPGTQFNYTDVGYTILSAVLATAADCSFESLMDELVWSPLGMSATGLDDVRRTVSGRGRYYELNDEGEIVNSPFVNYSYSWAGGGVLSSTQDLADYASALFDDDFLLPSERNTLFSAAKTADGAKTAYGFGWYVDIDAYLLARKNRLSDQEYQALDDAYNNRTLIWHSGTAAGSGAILMIEPASNAVLSLAVNMGNIEKETVILALDIMTMVARETDQPLRLN